LTSSTAIVLREEGLIAQLQGERREAICWLGRMCEYDLERSSAESSLTARVQDMAVIGGLARRLFSDPRSLVVERVRVHLSSWERGLDAFLSVTRTLDVTHQFALRLLVGRSIVSLDSLARAPEMATEASKISRLSSALRESFAIERSYEMLLTWYLPFTQLIQVPQPSEYLLDASTDAISLVHFSQVKKIKSNLAVSERLSALYALLRGTEGAAILARIQPVEVLVLYALFNRLVLNYVAHQDLKMDLHYQIVSNCAGIRQILQSSLDQLYERNQGEYNALWTRFQSTYGGLDQVWSEARILAGYPEGFLTDPVHVEVLRQLAGDNLEIYRKVVNKASVVIPGVSFVAGDDEFGFRIYRLPARDGVSQRLILAIQTRSLEDWRSHYDPRQAKVASLFSVVGHQAILSAAEAVYNRFVVVMEEEKTKPGQEGIDTLALTAVGFGLDGAVAQLIAHQWRKDHPLEITHPKQGHIALGFGVPRYLEVDSAAEVGSRGFVVSGMPCLYSLNFVNPEDTRINESFLSSMIAAEYSSANFYQFPLVDKVSTALDFTRHRSEDYAFNIGSAFGVPVVYYDQFSALQATIDRSRRRYKPVSAAFSAAALPSLDSSSRSSPSASRAAVASLPAVGSTESSSGSDE
jgi:hypothetical protein